MKVRVVNNVTGKVHAVIDCEALPRKDDAIIFKTEGGEKLTTLVLGIAFVVDESKDKEVHITALVKVNDKYVTSGLS